MSEQKELEEEYEKLIEQRSAMKGMVNKSRYKEIQDKIETVSRRLRESTNNLVRSLKENPNVSGNMIKVARDRTELHDLLLRCIQELRDRGTYHSITHRVDEENKATLDFRSLKEREKKLQEDVKKLESQVTEEEIEFKRITAEHNTAITTLKDNIQLKKGSTTTDARFKRKESLAYVSAIWREYKLKERVLENKLKELEDKLKTESVVNTETMKFLSDKKTAAEQKVEEWEAKFNTETDELKTKVDELTRKRSKRSNELKELQARKLNEIAEEKERREREAREEEETKKRNALQKRQNKAARKLQKEFRVYILRKKELDAIKAAAKNAKGSKKKGKGK
jgi:hypothetical protein